MVGEAPRRFFFHGEFTGIAVFCAFSSSPLKRVCNQLYSELCRAARKCNRLAAPFASVTSRLHFLSEFFDWGSLFSGGEGEVSLPKYESKILSPILKK